MTPTPARNLLTYLSQVPDPRGLQGRRHSLAAMLAAIVCGILCGARGYTAIAQWLHHQPVTVRQLLGFLRLPPTEGAFRKLLKVLSVSSFEQAVAQWTKDALGLTVTDATLRAVAIDGKMLRGTVDELRPTIHLLAALDHQTGCVLSQCAVPEGTNEAKTALTLLRNLVLNGRIVTGDAAFCQRDVCQQTLDSGGQYLFPVKDNQPLLRNAIVSELTAQKAAFPPLRTASA